MGEWNYEMKINKPVVTAAFIGKCRKCLCPEVTLSYFEDLGELQVTCFSCGYQWFSEPADKLNISKE